MKNVGDSYSLFLDTSTDKSHLISIWDNTPLITFNSDCTGFDAKGNIVCRLKTDKNNNWYAENEFGIKTKPVSFNKREGIFEVEADFCNQWLELQMDLAEKNQPKRKP